MPRKQQRQQPKCRQSVMRKLGFDERENDEDDRSAGQQIIIDVVALAP